MAIVGTFGNPAPIHKIDPDYTAEITTSFVFPDGVEADEAFTTITDLRDGMWVNQSGASAPSWVACSDADLEARLSEHYSVATKAVPGINSDIL